MHVAACGVLAALKKKEKKMTTNVAEGVVCALEPLLMIEDLERWLRVDRRTVYRLCKRGLIPRPMKVGQGNRWKAEDIAEAIERLRRPVSRRAAGRED
jgi:predicted DNA-binding transcriptional regulator AlpA